MMRTLIFLFMEKINEHIGQLDQILKEKGYDGYFATRGGYPGKLPESLDSYLKAIARNEEQGPAFPCWLYTYSYWKDEESKRVTCHFQIDYSAEDGFHINKLHIRLLDEYGKLQNQKELAIHSKEGIRTREAANEWINEIPYRPKIEGQRRIR